MSEPQGRGLRRELEEAHRELQAVTDELAAVSGELDIARRELDTLGDELEAVNAEVAALRTSFSDETGRAGETESLDAVLEALRIAAATLDGDLVVATWNRPAEALWGVAASDAVGHALDDLRIGLPTAEVHALVATVVAGEGAACREVKGTDLRRRPVSYELTCTPVRSPSPEAEGAVAALLLARVLDT